jgi:hypothetical protein
MSNKAFFFSFSEEKDEWSFILRQREFTNKYVPIELWITDKGNYIVHRVCYTEWQTRKLVQKSMEMTLVPDMYYITCLNGTITVSYNPYPDDDVIIRKNMDNKEETMLTNHNVEYTTLMNAIKEFAQINVTDVKSNIDSGVKAFIF